MNPKWLSWVSPPEGSHSTTTVTVSSASPWSEILVSFFYPAFEPHVNHISRITFSIPRNVGRLRHTFAFYAAETLCFVRFDTPDYCNSGPCGVPSTLQHQPSGTASKTRCGHNIQKHYSLSPFLHAWQPNKNVIIACNLHRNVHLERALLLWDGFLLSRLVVSRPGVLESDHVCRSIMCAMSRLVSDFTLCSPHLNIQSWKRPARIGPCNVRPGVLYQDLMILYHKECSPSTHII